MIVISRYVERRAWQVGAGRLRTSFQRLSRINDESGTREVYETLAGSDVQTHLYGVPDWDPPSGFEGEIHGGYTDDHRRSWFVIYTPPDDAGRGASGGDSEEGYVALLALEVAPREWEGFWTFRPSLVTDIDDYVARSL